MKKSKCKIALVTLMRNKLDKSKKWNNIIEKSTNYTLLDMKFVVKRYNIIICSDT